jgi:FtsP/CotA-like multicopper oxidase with cupredoxin domain
MTYFNRHDGSENLFCYMSSTSQGNQQSPTLRIYPNDTIDLTLRNCFSEGYSSLSSIPMLLNTSHPCGSHTLTKTSTNIHFHGFVIPATCHIDLVVSNVINYNEEYRISFTIPDIPKQRPGLYWYHPHIHRTTDTTVRGGASGAVIVEGIENLQPLVGGLSEQILIFRDTTRPGIFSMNYVTIITSVNKERKEPSFPTLTVRPNEKQFWRVLNAASGTFFYFQLEYNGVVQSFDVVSVDGFPLYIRDSDNGNHPERNIYSTTAILIAPASRYELIIKTPKVGDIAYLKSKISNIDGTRHGSEGILFQLFPSPTAPPAEVIIPVAEKENIQRYSVLQNSEWKEMKNEKPDKTRLFYFDQFINRTGGIFLFYLTEEGKAEALFNSNPSIPPLLTIYNNRTEDWIIQNRVNDVHTFHIHQGHFFLLSRNGKSATSFENQFLDNVVIPGTVSEKPPYENVTIRLDFRKFEIGDYVMHCHLLFHEDHGMMQKIRVIDSGNS